ncbi:MAG: gliding motility protein GldL [Prevotellaceae bacterium]|jgi:gliding motility-associated protein GldL|nr:gliding motility protein GldL [Prevotellaceae bacterium]
MAKTQATAVKQPSAFMTWYNSPVGQRTVGAFYSVGASIVIIGALFKIQHWMFASEILTLGMVTEAILFFIGVFEKPHKNYHWENMFPTLVGEEEDAVSLGRGSALPNASLSQEDSKKLESGIKQLSETAGQLGDISKAATTSVVFAQNLTEASDAAASFASKQKNLDSVSDGLFKSYQEISNTLSTVSAGTKNYAAKTDALHNSMSAINSIYELELKNIEGQAQAIKTQSEAISAQTGKITAASSDMEKLFATVVATANDMAAYKQQTEKLAKQVSDLNNVYGNMLNAIRS